MTEQALNMAPLLTARAPATAHADDAGDDAAGDFAAALAAAVHAQPALPSREPAAPLPVGMFAQQYRGVSAGEGPHVSAAQMSAERTAESSTSAAYSSELVRSNAPQVPSADATLHSSASVQATDVPPRAGEQPGSARTVERPAHDGVSPKTGPTASGTSVDTRDVLKPTEPVTSKEPRFTTAQPAAKQEVPRSKPFMATPAASAATASCNDTPATAAMTAGGSMASEAAPQARVQPVDGDGSSRVMDAGTGTPARELEAMSAAERVNSASAVATAGTANVRAVSRDRTMLQPEFRQKLERVIAGLEAMGHSVKVVETHRTQERQDFLFEQGRSRSGPVVTWTRNSAHTSGRAADIIIDGGAVNGPGYARFWELAANEGLRTLGARDPGHVELPGAGSEPVRTTQAPAIQQGSPHSAVAQVAAVAAPAAPAAIATVATVAQPGVVAPRLEAAPRATSSRSSDGGARGESSDSTIATQETAQAATAATAAAAPRGSSALDRVDIAGRVARVLQLQADAAAQPSSHVMLQLGEPGLDVGRVRVGLRAGSVAAAIDVNDTAHAMDLRTRLPELERALQQRGFEAGRLDVGAMSRGGLDAVLRTDAAASLDMLLAQYARTAERHTAPDPEHGGSRQNANTGSREDTAQQRRNRDAHQREEAK